MEKNNNSLHESAQRYLRLFEASQDGILILDYDSGLIEDANPFIVNLLGFSRQELIGKELWEIGMIKDKGAALAAYKVLKSHGFIRYNNLPLQAKDGHDVDVDFTAKVYDLDHHNIIQCLLRHSVNKMPEPNFYGISRIDYDEMANAFSSLIEKRDSYTAGHQVRVARLAVAIAQELKLESHMVDGVRFAAKIHDIGKIAVPTEILTKPGTLNSFEMAMLRHHAQAGFDVVKNMTFPWPVALTILQHHERLDGTGYPNQIKDGEIFFEARILAVADIVEAMTGRRPYRETPGLDTALALIKQGSGTLFDSGIVNACLKVFKNGFSFDMGAGSGPDTHEEDHL